MSTRSGRKEIARALAVGLLAVVLASACADVHRVSPLITGVTRAEIEELLRYRADAMQRRDATGFLATIDPSRDRYRRWQQAAFDNAPIWGTRPSTKVAKLEPYGATYVRVWIENGAKDFLGPSYGGYAREYLRREAGQWVLTEPLPTEIGSMRTITAGPVGLTYWDIDEPVVASLRTSMRDAWQRVSRQLGGTVEPGWQAFLYPTAESMSSLLMGANPTVSWTIAFRAPYSRVLHLSPHYPLLADGLSSLSQLSRDGFAAMATGSVLSDRHPIGTETLASSDEWLYRGLALNAFEVPFEQQTAPLCASSPLSLLTMRHGPDLTSTAPDAVGRNVYAAKMVDYLSQRTGPTAAADLYAAAERTRDAVGAFQSVVGVDRERFYTDFLVWANKKFC